MSLKWSNFLLVKNQVTYGFGANAGYKSEHKVKRHILINLNLRLRIPMKSDAHAIQHPINEINIILWFIGIYYLIIILSLKLQHPFMMMSFQKVLLAESVQR
jgi:hypothetical protein